MPIYKHLPDLPAPILHIRRLFAHPALAWAGSVGLALLLAACRRRY